METGASGEGGAEGGEGGWMDAGSAGQTGWWENRWRKSSNERPEYLKLQEE